jgi:hypothetical protein
MSVSGQYVVVIRKCVYNKDLFEATKLWLPNPGIIHFSRYKFGGLSAQLIRKKVKREMDMGTFYLRRFL